MDKIIGKLIGTKRAGEDAEIVDHGGQVWVRWLKSGEVVKFASRAAFDPWTAYNRFIERIEWA